MLLGAVGSSAGRVSIIIVLCKRGKKKKKKGNLDNNIVTT